MDRTAVIFLELIPDTPVGPIALAASELGLIAVEIGVRDLREWSRLKQFPRETARFESGPFQAAAQLEAYFKGVLRRFEVPLDLRGRTGFQRAVFQAVEAVPYGGTQTYGRIAAQIAGERGQTNGRPGAARAVGRANAANPLPIVIPCHRLVGSDGSLRGYGAPGGIETKAWLLAFEAEQARKTG